MSKLNFSNIAEAYSIPSKNIQETSDKLEELKEKAIQSAGLVPSPPSPPSPQSPREEYLRVPNPCNDDLEYNFLKMTRQPGFDSLLKNYISMKHPGFVKESFGSVVNTDIRNYVIFFLVSISLYLLLSLLLKK
uniref:Uncharacterized protein n=1 Tax=viral metagenome TaxID=1070528 RepID=A0A6C0I8J9_9ZZZZ